MSLPTVIENIFNQQIEELDSHAKNGPKTYVSLPSVLFLYLEQAPCDIFFEIDQNFLKLFYVEDKIERKMIETLINTNVKELFIPMDQRQSFSNYLKSKTNLTPAR